jgi:protein-S-isoprenylcysteine O-methyltransferase Ste14
LLVTIQKKLAAQGAFLFRWRSFIPLFLLIPGLMAFSDSAMFEIRYGDFFDEAWVVIGLFISIAGLAVRWVTVGFVPGSTSGRNTKEQRADHLNTDGMYSIVKNPLYLGNYLTILGVLVSIKVWWLVLIGSLAYWLYIERIIAAEESFLADKYGRNYTDWAENTPIFVPDLRLWRKPAMSFSYRTVLKREYNGLMAVAAAFFVSEFLIDVAFQREPLRLWLREDWPWVAGFCITGLVFLTLRTLKKHTRFLKVEGR